MSNVQNCSSISDWLSKCFWNLPIPGSSTAEGTRHSSQGVWEPVPVLGSESSAGTAFQHSSPCFFAAASLENSVSRLAVGTLPFEDCIQEKYALSVQVVPSDLGCLLDQRIWIEPTQHSHTLLVYALLLVERTDKKLEIWWRRWKMSLAWSPRVHLLSWRPRQNGVNAASFSVEDSATMVQFAWIERRVSGPYASVTGYCLTSSWLWRFQLAEESWSASGMFASIGLERLVRLQAPVLRVLRWVRSLHKNDSMMLLLQNNQVCSLPSAACQTLDSVVAPGCSIDDVVALHEYGDRAHWLIHCTDGLMYPIQIDQLGHLRKLPIESTYRLIPGSRLECLRPPRPNVHGPVSVDAALKGGPEKMSLKTKDEDSSHLHPDVDVEGDERNHRSQREARSSDIYPELGASDPDREIGSTFSGRSGPNESSIGRRQQQVSTSCEEMELKAHENSFQSERSGCAPSEYAERFPCSSARAERSSADDCNGGDRSLQRYLVHRFGSGICLIQYDAETGAMNEFTVLDGTITALCLFEAPVFLATFRLPNDPLPVERLGCFPRVLLNGQTLQTKSTSWPLSPHCSLEPMLDVITHVSRDRETNLRAQHEQLERALLMLRPAAQYAYLLSLTDYEREQIAKLFSVDVQLEQPKEDPPILRLAVRLATHTGPYPAMTIRSLPLSEGCSFVAFICRASNLSSDVAAQDMLAKVAQSYSTADPSRKTTVHDILEGWSVVRCVSAGPWTDADDERVLRLPLCLSSHAPLRVCLLLCFHGCTEMPATEGSPSIAKNLQSMFSNGQSWWLPLDDRQLDLFDLVQRVSDTSGMAILPPSLHVQTGVLGEVLSEQSARATQRGQRQVAGVSAEVLRDLFPRQWPASLASDSWDVFVETILGARFQMHGQPHAIAPSRYLVTLTGTLDVISWARVALMRRCERVLSPDGTETGRTVYLRNDHEPLPAFVRHQLEEWLAASMSRRRSSVADESLVSVPGAERATDELSQIRLDVSSFHERLEHIYRVYELMFP